jgi:hypothetical protein
MATTLQCFPPTPPPLAARKHALVQSNFYSGDFIDRSASGLVGLTNQGMTGI